MKSTILILFLFALLAVVIQIVKQKAPKKEPKYKKIGKLFTSAERSFLGVLDTAIGNDYRIMGKVRVADVLTPEKGIDKKTWQSAFNKISAKHFDYIICDKQTLEPLAAIELDDSSHENKTRVIRDEFLEAVCKSATFKLIRVKARRSYSVETVKNAIEETLNPEKKLEAEKVNEPEQRKIAQ